MNSWPATLVDWKQLTGRLRHGDLVCVVHGRVDELLVDELPVCPHCRQLLSRTVRDRRTGRVAAFAEPWPARCPTGHVLGPGDVLLSWRSCTCAAAAPGPGGHRTWRCQRPDCSAAPMLYPPCTAPADLEVVRLADHQREHTGPPGGPPRPPGGLPRPPGGLPIGPAPDREGETP